MNDRFVIAALGALAIAGCASKGQQAENQYQLLAASHVPGNELCGAALLALDAYGQSRDKANYERFRRTEGLACQSYEMHSKYASAAQSERSGE